ncbi:MAG: hypothetical protein A2418_01320 [Candidatus Brennerbacteria bacterium RIFOXYC1_FULL_41_11]|uniref:General secretion pathway GspH domain-containing protein n=1 Tax=Candidatus Brennerbacteria bacterium RIFOXYD1_FULL_41_16 TaxID=1797529 RepID=A0A1G1XLD8_9BACT|nr:MAG: hypothetical protein A2391_00090 [Candidatus Brennerbacteria bacterium RIFOXYB1_FULL_41_13]OGY39214.1 MAG: hypothetical protein A2418_01320 [Candidatus Brennerbacteria bacterium RIFOXYC1_FULL_41_11]OGY40496.1 MAG: hypothetical protein A2570_01980 [Candidatus Brennerbacteria bacterium RIFOXYD1_FULL_41_16]
MVFKNGFSLVEVVIVIGLISILASLGLFFSLGYYNVYVLNAETDLLATLFKKTRTRAIGNFNQSRHGVFVDSINRQYIVFQGNSFAARDPVFDEVVGNSSSRVELSGDAEAVFDQFSGSVNQNRVFILRISEREQRVELNALGGINY